MIIAKDDVRFIFRRIASHFISCTNKIVILTILQSAVVTIDEVQQSSLLPDRSHILGPDICVSGCFFYNLFIKCTFRKIANFWRLRIFKVNCIANDCVANTHDLAVIGFIYDVAATYGHDLATADVNYFPKRLDCLFRIRKKTFHILVDQAFKIFVPISNNSAIGIRNDIAGTIN